MKKLLYILILSLLTMACADQRGTRVVKAPLSPKRGDGYIFSERLEHKQNFDYLIENEDITTFIFRTRADDVEKIELFINNDAKDMELIGKQAYYDYYTVNFKTENQGEYYFKLTDDKKTLYYGVNLSENIEELEKFRINSKTLTEKNNTDWMKELIVYDIFVDRFRNGNKENDPIYSEFGPEAHKQPMGTLEGGTPKTYLISSFRWGLDEEKELGEFTINSWGSDWNKKEEWEKKLEESGDIKSKYYRFYGGDLQGIINKLDYIKEKGFTAIKLSPVFYSRSNHKYDTADYRHVSPDFGIIEQIGKEYPYESNVKIFSEEGKSELKALEKINGELAEIENKDNSTWLWTESDLLFAELIKKAHEREIRVILEINMSNVANEFWAFEKALIEGPKSEYANWFYFTDWEKVKEYKKSNLDIWNPLVEYKGKAEIGVVSRKGLKYRRRWVETKQSYSLKEKNEILIWNKANVNYESVGKTKELVNLNYENSDLSSYMKESLKKWLKGPDDKVSEKYTEDDGIDALSIDMSKEELDEKFFEDLKEELKGVKSDFAIEMEIWLNAYEQNSDYDYDGIKNYQLTSYINDFVLGDKNNKISGEELKVKTELLRLRMQDNILKKSGLYLSSKDSDRIFSMLINRGRAYDGKNSEDDISYLTIRPDYYTEDYLFTLKFLTVLQMTYPGVPVVYYGDEIGMWGGDDPNSRKPMIWDDVEYEKESDDLSKYKKINKSFGEEVETDEANAEIRYEVSKNEDIENCYKNIIDIREKYNEIFCNGSIKYILIDDKNGVLVYQRVYKEKKIMVLINKGSKEQDLTLELNEKGTYEDINEDEKYNVIDGKVEINIKEKSIKIIYSKKG